MGTLYFTQSSRSVCSRALLRWTIRFTAKGASLSVSSAFSRCSHCSNTPSGRAFSEGKEPTIPLRHCASTRSGCDTMNMGAAMAGSCRRLFSQSGRLMVG